MRQLDKDLDAGLIGKRSARSKIASAHGICSHANAYNLEKSLRLEELKAKVGRIYA